MRIISLQYLKILCKLVGVERIIFPSAIVLRWTSSFSKSTLPIPISSFGANMSLWRLMSCNPVWLVSKGFHFSSFRVLASLYGVCTKSINYLISRPFLKQRKFAPAPKMNLKWWRSARFRYQFYMFYTVSARVRLKIRKMNANVSCGTLWEIVQKSWLTLWYMGTNGIIGLMVCNLKVVNEERQISKWKRRDCNV